MSSASSVQKIRAYFKRLRQEGFSPRFILSRLLLWSGRDTSIKLTFNAKHNIRTYLHASSAAHKLFVGKYHADTDIAVFEKYIEAGDTVFDVGANIGMFTTLASRLVGKQGRVYAFEPTADTFVHLLENLDLNQVENTLPVYGAVSESESEVRIHDHARSKEQNHIDLEAQTGRLVPAYQLDPFCNSVGVSKIHFLKIDVEGAELPALKSLGEMISQVQTMYVEVSEENFAVFGYTIDDLFKYLDTYDFDVYIPRLVDGKLMEEAYSPGSQIQGRNIIAHNRNYNVKE